MIRRLAFILALLAPLPALAFATDDVVTYSDSTGAHVHDSGISVTVVAPHVATNAALAAASTLTYPSGVWRDDYSAGLGAPPLWYLPSNSACSLNSGNGDNGSQVKSADSKCWLAVFPTGGQDVREYGAVGNGIADVGPAFRAACSAVAGTGQPVIVQRALYLFKTLDASGLGAIVIGTTEAGNPHLSACNMTGESSSDYPDTCAFGSPYLKLDAGLNRPLVYVRTNTESPLWQNMCLDGNGPAQSGWSGGPNSKLYTVQVADDASFEIDTSIRFDRMVILGGYNGNVYIGGNRGGSWFRDTWIMYSGHSTSDTALVLNGFDGTFYNLATGNNTGVGIFIGEGSQYQFTDGATFLNGAQGLEVGGGHVEYLSMSGMNFQDNGKEGIRVLNIAPFAGAAVFGHMFSNLIFDSNSLSSTGTYSDVFLEDTNQYDRFVNINFGGTVANTGTTPKYNIETAGSATTRISNISFGSGTPNTLGFTNNLTKIFGDVPVPRTWTPVLAGSGTAGTFTPSIQMGNWAINQNFVTANFSLNGTLSGASGNLIVSGLPLFSGATANQNGHCYLTKVSGWTTAGGSFTWLAGIVAPSGTSISITKNGSALGGNVPAVGEFSGSIDLYGSCQYSVDQLP